MTFGAAGRRERRPLDVTPCSRGRDVAGNGRDVPEAEPLNPAQSTLPPSGAKLPSALTDSMLPHRTKPGRKWLSQLAPLWFMRARLVDPDRLAVRRYTMPIEGLPRELEGLRIGHVSDIHLGRCVSADYARQVVSRTLALRPDIIALTGDYVENASSPIGLLAELLAPLADPARSGAIASVAVLGNHDWYAGPERVSAALRSAGLTVLDNARLFIDRKRDVVSGTSHPDALCIAGLGDLGHDDTRPHTALGGVDPDAPRIALAHHPDTAEEEIFAINEDLRVDLMLSGHTHGGQIRLPLIGAPIVPGRYGRKYLGGVTQGPAFRVLVSRGAGMTMLPFRIGVPPEIGEITLVRAAKQA